MIYPLEPVPNAEPLRSVAVIGAGQRGRAFALRCAQAGFRVVLEDVLSSNLRKAEEVLAATPGVPRERVQLASSVEDAVREADVAIDFVPDELESKLEIFSMMDRMAPPRTIFCTPTVLSIADLASCTYRPQLCLGVAPFEDRIQVPLRLIRGQATDETAVVRVKALLETMGATVEVSFDPAEPMLMRNRPDLFAVRVSP